NDSDFIPARHRQGAVGLPPCCPPTPGPQRAPMASPPEDHRCPVVTRRANNRLQRDSTVPPTPSGNLLPPSVTAVRPRDGRSKSLRGYGEDLASVGRRRKLSSLLARRKKIRAGDLPWKDAGPEFARGFVAHFLNVTGCVGWPWIWARRVWAASAWRVPGRV